MSKFVKLCSKVLGNKRGNNLFLFTSQSGH